MAKYKASDVAHYILSECYRNGSPISNLQLQKMLYFLQIIHLDTTGELLFDDEFYAWPYGPVIPHIYREFSQFGSRPIRYGRSDSSFLDSNDKAFIDAGIRVLRRKSPWDLVRVSHADGSPWDVVYNQRGDRKGHIENQLLIGSVRQTVNA